MKKRKFILPLLLIFFLLLILGINKWKELDLDLNLNLGQKIVSPLPVASQESILEEKLNQYGMAVKNLQMMGDAAVASISGTTTAYFNLKEDLVSQVVSLQFILSRAKIEGKLPKIVDLRFDKPVVSY